MARIPKNVVAVTPGGNITMDHILGFYALYTVPDQPVSAAKLSRLWAAEGLPPGVIPRERRSVHAFQYACRSIESRRTIGVEEHEEQISVDEIYTNPEECVYQVTRVVRDKTNKVIDHPKAMRVIYDQTTDHIRWEPLDRSVPRKNLDALGTAIRDHFEKNAKKVPGSTIRTAIREVFRVVGATNVKGRSGGIYFVPKEGKMYLDSLTVLLDELYGDDALLHLIFCANAEGEKALIEKTFTTEVSEALDQIMADATDALTGNRQLRKDKLRNMLDKRRELGDLRTKYSEMLDTELGQVGTKIGLLDEQLEALVMKSTED